MEKKTKNIALQSDMFQTTNQPRSSVHSQSQHVHPDVSEMPLADGLAREPPKGYVQWEKTMVRSTHILGIREPPDMYIYIYTYV